MEHLEQALMPGTQIEPRVLVVQFVNQQRQVVNSFSVELAPPVPGWNGRSRWAAQRPGGRRV